MNTNNTNNNTPARAKTGDTTNARFIELLNLCVDDQLTPAEAAELDDALLASPARRRTYEQYCRMTQACAQLFQIDPARAQAHATPALARALADAERKIAAERSRSGSRSGDARPLLAWWRGLFAIGGLAALGAAAAIALLLHTPAPDATTRNDASAADASAVTASLAAANAVTASAVTDNAATDTDMGLKTQDSGLRPRHDTNAAADMTAATAAVQTAKPLQPFSLSALQPFQSNRFRFPVVTTFSDDTSRSLAPDDSAIAWTKDVQLRPIRKVSATDAADAIESLTRIAKPQISSTALPFPAAAAQEDADEMSAFQYHK